MEEKQEKPSGAGMDTDAGGQNRRMLGQIMDAMEKEDYRTAFRLCHNNIVKILCGEGVLDVCSPYYLHGEEVKEDKVIGELVGVYEYYSATNGGYRSFRPHGVSFRCGSATTSFMGAVRELLGLFADAPEQDPWEIYCDHMDSNFFDLESYTDQAAVYSFPHNRRSREVTRGALAHYALKYYGSMDAEEFIGLYQTLDRVYTTYGFPFACTHAGWFFEGYDVLYRKTLEEGVWSLRNLWEQGVPSDWLGKQMEPYPDIRPVYGDLIKALQRPEYEHLLCRLFPLRLTEGTLRSGCGMDTDEWEEFALKLAKTLYFAECCSWKKNVPEEMMQEAVKAMEGVLEVVRCYCMDEGKKGGLLSGD